MSESQRRVSVLGNTPDRLREPPHTISHGDSLDKIISTMKDDLLATPQSHRVNEHPYSSASSRHLPQKATSLRNLPKLEHRSQTDLRD